MRRRVLEVLILLAVVAGVAFMKSMEQEPSIVGTWVGQSGSHRVEMEFGIDGAFFLGIGTMQLNGSYSIRVSPDNPDVHFLDIPNQSGPSKALLKFQSEDTILFQDTAESRPRYFDDRSFELHRVFK